MGGGIREQDSVARKSEPDEHDHATIAVGSAGPDSPLLSRALA